MDGKETKDKTHHESQTVTKDMDGLTSMIGVIKADNHDWNGNKDVC